MDRVSSDYLEEKFRNRGDTMEKIYCTVKECGGIVVADTDDDHHIVGYYCNKCRAVYE